jgi:hypothetical protein
MPASVSRSAPCICLSTVRDTKKLADGLLRAGFENTTNSVLMAGLGGLLDVIKSAKKEV